jgi:adenylyltransferase/sulfurtransferase
MDNNFRYKITLFKSLPGKSMPNEIAIEITVQDVKARLDQKQDMLLLDCREQVEFDTARIESGVLIPMNEIPERVTEIEAYREKPIVVFCHGGVRSLRVTQFLREQGFGQCQSMAGGIHAWSVEIDSSVPTY